MSATTIWRFSMGLFLAASLALYAAGCAGPETRREHPNRFDLARPCDTPDGTLLPQKPSR